MSTFKESFRNNKKIILILSIIILVGIFFRTYNFHDWLRFSRDQVRDVSLIDNALENKSPLPLLGPNAGTTKFQLGPIYYQFSYVSEKIFGNHPDKMAYPSVFFSILAIPLLFLFLQEYFSKNISLMLTTIMSVSYFMVINSRFSSNPNLIPFFILVYLYSLLKLLGLNGKMTYLWSALIGISMGVCIQLHTTLLIVLPIMSLIVFFYLLTKKKPNIWKIALIILVTTLILNTSQIISEFYSHGQNTQYFFKGFTASSGSSSHLGRDTFHIFACQIQANSHIIAAFGSDDPCSAIFYTPQGTTAENYKYYLGMALSVLFSIIGYRLLFKYFLQKRDAKEKNFLGIVILFNLLSFIILIPIAKIIFVGYFINLFMVPLVLFGLLVQELEKKYGKIGKNLSLLFLVLLVFCSLLRDAQTANSYMQGTENNAKNSTLSEVEAMSQFMLSHSSKEYPKQYLSGQTGLAERFFRPVNYFTLSAGVETALLKPGDEKKIEVGNPIYYLTTNSSENISPGQKIWDHEVISAKKLSGLTILILEH